MACERVVPTGPRTEVAQLTVAHTHTHTKRGDGNGTADIKLLLISS